MLVLLRGVLLHIRRFNWVVAHIALLQAIAHVHAAVLLVLGDGEGPWPTERLNDIEGVGDGALLVVVRLLVSNHLGQPSGFKPGHGLVLIQGSVRIHNGV